MSLVGDVLLGARELFTDLPQALGAPVSMTLAPVAGTAFAPGNYYVVATQLNQWGESIGTVEQLITTVGTGNIQATLGIFRAATAVRVYIGTVAGGEYFYQQFSSPGASSLIVTVDLSTQIFQTPPTRSTAYVPDSDGAAVSAYALYRWFNDALTWASAKNRGGMPDFGAAGTVAGQPNYTMPGYWKKIDNAWYDGYPLGLLSKNNVFRRQPVIGYSGCLTVFQATDRLMVEAWPQPARTSGTSTLSSGMTATDTVANLTSTAGILLGFGLCQIGSEIVNFAAISGNTLIGLTRGMCGTLPVAHNAAEATTELNLMIAGFRDASRPSIYSVGNAASTLYLPPGWSDALISYLLYRFRKAEQDEQGAKAALGEATQKMSDLSANRIIAGPRQIQPYGAQGPETATGLGSPFGGVLIP